MGNFRKTKKEAWKYYKTWMREKTYSPTLKKEIKITRKGWDHLFRGSKMKRRNLENKLHKLSLLKSAKHVIKNTTSYWTEKKDKTKYLILKGTFEQKRIRVILKKGKDGNLLFYSVMQK